MGNAQVQKSNIFMIKHDVGHSLKKPHLGHAFFDGGTVGAGTLSADITLKFTIDGNDYSVTAKTAADAADTFNAIRTAVAADEQLGELIDVSGDATEIIFTRITPGDFIVEAVSPEAGVVIGNLSIGSPIEVKASEYNIISMEVPHPNDLLTGEYKILTEDTSAAYAADAATRTSYYSQSGHNIIDSIAAASAPQNQSVSFVVTKIEGNNITFEYDSMQMDPGTGAQTSSKGNIIADKSGGAALIQ